MGNIRKAMLLPTVVAVATIVGLTSCTSDHPDRDEPSLAATTPATPGAESADRLVNRITALTDFQGRPLYVVPEGQTRNQLDAMAQPPSFERTYTPAECAPESAFTPPPAGLEGVFARSNLSDDQSRLRVWLYTASEEAELVEYFVGSNPEAPIRCTDFVMTTGGVSQKFSYTPLDAPRVPSLSRSVQYSVTQDNATTHHVSVSAVNGTVAATVTLSTVEPADQATIEAVLDLARQATS